MLQQHQINAEESFQFTVQALQPDSVERPGTPRPDSRVQKLKEMVDDSAVKPIIIMQELEERDEL